MTKRVRDIEWLLQWAIRDELKKRRQVRRRGRPSAIIPSAWDSITNYYTLGTRIDVSRRSRDPFGLTLGAPHDDAKAGDPHDDAKAVARAVNALPKDQSFANIEKVRALMRDYEVPAIEAGERVTRNLLCLPGSILEKALFAEKYNVTNIVIIHAQGARRPSSEFRPMPRQVKGTRGQPQLNGKCYGKDRYGLNAHMPLEYWPSVESVMCARANYAVWHAALDQLAVELAGTLTEYEVSGPAAPAEPWITGKPVLSSNDHAEAPRHSVCRTANGQRPRHLGRGSRLVMNTSREMSRLRCGSTKPYDIVASKGRPRSRLTNGHPA
jgi:hypothetical protein